MTQSVQAKRARTGRIGFRKALVASLSATALIAGTMTGAAQAQSVYSFGDSLSDTGNVDALTFGLAVGNEYFDGRFSNGFLWTDFVSAGLAGELQRTNAGLIGPFNFGTSASYNFAHGGSVSGSNGLSFDIILGGFSTALLQALPAFRTVDQAEHFRDQRFFFRRVFRSGPDDFATISAGGNDYLNGVTNVNFVVGNIIQSLGIIRQAGVRNSIVLDLPSLGLIPREFGGSDSAQLNALSAAHNAQLRTAVAQFEARNPGTNVSIVPAGLLFDLIIDDAVTNGGRRFGFTNVRPGAGTSGTCLGDGLVLNACPGSYLFYDDIHPTARAHAIIGQVALANVRADLTAGAAATARTTTTNRIAATGNQLVTTRIAALREGRTGSGFLLDPGAHSGAFGGGSATLGFREVGAVTSQPARTSFFRYIDGLAPEYDVTTPANDLEAENLAFSFNLNAGEYVSSFGADHLLTERFAFGGVFTRAALSRDLFGINSRDEASEFAVYGAWFDGPWTLSVTSKAADFEQSFVRNSGLSFAPTVSGEARSRTSSLRFDAQYDATVAGFQLSALSKTAFVRVNHRGYEEAGGLGLVERSVPDVTQNGFTGYIGGRVARTVAPFDGAGLTLSFEGGALGASSRDIGFAPVVDDAALLGDLLGQDGFTRPLSGTAHVGGYGSAEVALTTKSSFQLSGRAATIGTAAGQTNVARLNAVWRF